MNYVSTRGTGEPVPPAMLLPVPEATGATPDSAPASPPPTSGPVPAPGPALAGQTLVPAATANRLQTVLPRAREAARVILGECQGTLISLEAALALRLDPDCIPAHGEAYARKPGLPRIPKRVVSWLLRRRVA